MTTDQICDAIKETLRTKNAAYGQAASRPPVLVPSLPPTTAILVRMSDKIERLRTLLTSNVDNIGESLNDTVADLAGYCILYLANKGDTSNEQS